MNKLSILSPCYNGERFLDNYFSNLMEQTYQDYEIIIVNDGSTDNSDKIIQKYKDIFEKKGYTFKYLNKQKNEGHAKAINDGLKLVEGTYLMWPDIDDHMHSDHLASRIFFMDNNQEYDIALGKCGVYDVNNLETPLFYAWKIFPKTKKELINEFILGEDKNIGFMSGIFIIRTQSFFEIYKTRSIYADIKVGPTIQMVFPLLYKGKTGYIDNDTFDYYIHGNNQHIANAKSDYYNIQLVYENVVEQIGLEATEAKKIIAMAQNVSNRLLLSYSLRVNDKVLAKNSWKKLKNNCGVRLKEAMKYIIIRSPLLYKIYTKF